MEAEKLLKLLGEHVRNLRKARKLSQERLAELSDLHPTYISDIERGKANLSFCAVDTLAQAFGLSLAEFVDLPQKGKSADGELLAIYSEVKQLDSRRRKAFTAVARALIAEIRGL
ncbi:helix-turn-helix domain-containing protein [Geobacter pickeringii]|uniref:helix-turn-helix domain-containing protein n=1 Tax=Geobacter pickeringii TaxID=345632 RepID=UPI0011872EEF|nr:helix-turn-helix transcriptional regulator [Geobacter pickeringii]